MRELDIHKEEVGRAALSDYGSAGYAYLVGDASMLDFQTDRRNHTATGTLPWPFLSLSVPLPQLDKSTFAKCQIHIPLANTIFVTGQEAVSFTAELERPGDSDSFRITNTLNVSNISTNWPFEKADYANQGSHIALTAPLTPLTAPRAIKDAFGNIVRQISRFRVNDAAIPASSELEAAVPAFFKTINEPQSSVAAWALVGAKYPVRCLPSNEDDKSLQNTWAASRTLDIFRPLSSGARLHRVLGGGGGWGKRAGLLSLEPDTGPRSELAATSPVSIPNENVEYSEHSILANVAKAGEAIQFFIHRPESNASIKAQSPDDLRLWSLEVGTIPSSIDTAPAAAPTHDAVKEQTACEYVADHFGVLSERGFYLEFIKHGPSIVKQCSTRTKVDVPFSRFSVIQANPRLDRQSARAQPKAVKRKGNSGSRQSLSSGIKGDSLKTEGSGSDFSAPSSEGSDGTSIRKVYTKTDLSSNPQLLQELLARTEIELNLLQTSTDTLGQNVTGIALHLLKSLHYLSPFVRLYIPLCENRATSTRFWHYLRYILKTESTARASHANPGLPRPVEHALQDLGLQVFLVEMGLRDTGWTLVNAVSQKMGYSFAKIDQVKHKEFYRQIEQCLARSQHERRRFQGRNSVVNHASDYRHLREHIRQRRAIKVRKVRAPVKIRRFRSPRIIRHFTSTHAGQEGSTHNFDIESKIKPEEGKIMIRTFLPFPPIRKTASMREFAQAQHLHNRMSRAIIGGDTAGAQGDGQYYNAEVLNRVIDDAPKVRYEYRDSAQMDEPKDVERGLQVIRYHKWAKGEPQDANFESHSSPKEVSRISESTASPAITKVDSGVSTDSQIEVTDLSVGGVSKDRRSSSHIRRQRRESPKRSEIKLKIRKVESTKGHERSTKQKFRLRIRQYIHTPYSKPSHLRGLVFKLLDELAEASLSPSSPELPQPLRDGFQDLLNRGREESPSSLRITLQPLLLAHLENHPTITDALPPEGSDETRLNRSYRSLLRNAVRAWTGSKAPRQEGEVQIRKWLVAPAEPPEQKIRIVRVWYGNTFRKLPLTFSKVRISAPATKVASRMPLVRRTRVSWRRRDGTTVERRAWRKYKPAFRKRGVFRVRGYSARPAWRMHKPTFRKLKVSRAGGFERKAPLVRRVKVRARAPSASDRDSHAFDEGAKAVRMTDGLDARSAWEQLSHRAASALMGHERSQNLRKLREGRQRLREERRRARARELVEQVSVLLEGVNGDEPTSAPTPEGEGASGRKSEGVEIGKSGRKWDWSTANDALRADIRTPKPAENVSRSKGDWSNVNEASVGPLSATADAISTGSRKGGKVPSRKELKEDVQGLLEGFNP